ncbi:osmiophilic body protein, putative (G377) [Plasmodium ovale curtisi]|uniref:Osmiophilic body protein, putative (G377) n=1 Tax=Plasmodium ovale curtisi TaxID=864141 RepID=A0A1A8W857_PLAOA|nr:osmiophilic body protein, putative (G377) [Plasmodium ovale curtisi]
MMASVWALLLLPLLYTAGMCQRTLNFNKVIKYLKDAKVLPENIPDVLEEAIQIVPPYLIYRYKGRIYYLHNNVDISPVEDKKPEPVFPLDVDEEKAEECYLPHGIDVVAPVKPSHGSSGEPDVEKGKEEREENEDPMKGVIIDEETGMIIPNKYKNVVNEETEEILFQIPKVTELTTEEKEKNKIMYIFQKEGGTTFHVKEIIAYKENKDIIKNVKIGYERFFEDTFNDIEERKNNSIVHNVKINDYYTFLKSLHIFFKNNDVNKFYTINNVSKYDIELFLKQAYRNLHHDLHRHILYTGYSFENYTYSADEFSINKVINDFFALTKDINDDDGNFQNLFSNIKYIPSTKEKLNVRMIDKAIKQFLKENNLKMIDIKLIYHLFTRNRVLNLNEEDIIKYASDMVNMTEVDISPRVIATLFTYLLQKVNILLMPNYPTTSKYSSILFLENNDLLITIENIYKEFMINFFKYNKPSDDDISRKESHQKALSITPWADKIYSQFHSTYDFLSMKYGIVLLYNTYHMVINFFEGDPKIKAVINTHRTQNKINTLEHFFNELISLFQIDKNRVVKKGASLLSLQKPFQRILSVVNDNPEDGTDQGDHDNDDHDEDDDVERELTEEKAREELKREVETELEEERKKYLIQKDEERKKKKKEEEDAIAVIDEKHELETQELEKEEVQKEKQQDEKFDREYEADNQSELEFNKELEEAAKSRGDVVHVGVPSDKSDEAFYYNIAYNYIYKRTEDIYKSTIGSGFEYANTIERKMEEVFILMKRSGPPNYEDIKMKVIGKIDEDFENVKIKIGKKEFKKNINTYKTELESAFGELQKKEDEKYIIIEKVIADTIKTYKDDMMKFCNKRFYANFRKNLSKRKLKMMKEFRAALMHTIRIAKDLAPSYDESEYTKTFTDIYLEKRTFYRNEYAKSRRLISRALDKNVREQLGEHYAEKDIIINAALQQIREHVIDKINSLIAELYNNMHVELQIDRLQLTGQMKEIHHRVIALTKEEKILTTDLRVLEHSYNNLGTLTNPAQKKAKEVSLTNEIATMKEKIANNKREITKMQTELHTASEKYDEVISKMDVIHELEKNLRFFKYNVYKEHKYNKVVRETLVTHYDDLSDMYIATENVIKDLLLALDNLQIEETELKIKLGIIHSRKRDIEMEVAVRTKIYPNGSNETYTHKNDEKKQMLETITTEFNKLSKDLDKLYIKREIILNDVNFLTSDNAREIPESIKIFLPSVTEIVHTEKQPYEDFVKSLRKDLEVKNDAFRKFVMSFDKSLDDYEHHLIFPFDCLPIVQEERRMYEKHQGRYLKGVSILSTRVRSFHFDLKKYVQLRKKVESGKDEMEINQYLERNIVHLSDMSKKLRNGKIIPDFSYILTDQEYFLKNITNEKEETKEAYDDLLKTYAKLQTMGNAINEHLRKSIAYHVQQKHTTDKMTWYKAIMKLYTERSNAIYTNSYDNNKLSRGDVDEILSKKASSYLAYPILLQYGGSIWDDPFEKKKYLRIVKDEETYPYALKEIKDVYVLEKIIKDSIIRSNKLNELRGYMDVKAYTVVEKKDAKMQLFQEDELQKWNLLTEEGKIVLGNLQNFFSHIKGLTKWENIEDISTTATELLKQSNMSYDAILEVIRFLKENPNIINIKDLITLSELILENSNIYFLQADTLCLYILSTLELLGIKVQMDDIRRKDKKSRIITYLNILKKYHKKEKIKDEIKGYVLRFLLPSKEPTMVKYNPKLIEFFTSLNDALDGSTSLYENFKINSSEFHNELIKAFKEGLNDFFNYYFTKIITNKPSVTSETYYLSSYSPKEKTEFLFYHYSYEKTEFNKILSLLFYMLNPGLRKLLNDHSIDTDVDCLREFKGFNFSNVFTFLQNEDVNVAFKTIMDKHKFVKIPPMGALLKIFLNNSNEDFLTYENVSQVVERYFTSEQFDQNTKHMIIKLVYSLLTRLGYLSVSSFKSEMGSLIHQSDLHLITLFHTILNKINYLLYCKNEKMYLERYAPVNLFERNKPYKLDALKIYYGFLNVIPENERRPVVNFFESDFINVTMNILKDMFTFVNKLFQDNKSQLESEDENKLESFFKITTSFTNNRNVLHDNYDEFIKGKNEYKDIPILFARKITYDNDTKEVQYKQYPDLNDIIDEKSFGILTEVLLKENITFTDVNLRFSKFMKENNFFFPKWTYFKTEMKKPKGDLINVELYKYLYDKFQKLHIPQPVHDIYYVFLRRIIDYVIEPRKIVEEEDVEDLTKELKYKYTRFTQFLEGISKCLFNFYYMNVTDDCEQYGSFTQEELTPEQKLLYILQSPFIDILQHNYNIPLRMEYSSPQDAIYFDFFKQFVPSYETMKKDHLDVEVFKLKYFSLEILKYVLRTVTSKMPPQYMTSMKYEDFNIRIDTILANLHTFFASVLKEKGQLSSENISQKVNGVGSVSNFMKSKVEDGKNTYESVKYYLNNYITEYFLKHNMSFKYFNEFTKNIDKFKSYFPSLSEMYIFLEKRVNIINSLYSSSFTKMAKTELFTSAAVHRDNFSPVHRCIETTSHQCIGASRQLFTSASVHRDNFSPVQQHINETFHHMNFAIATPRMRLTAATELPQSRHRAATELPQSCHRAATEPPYGELYMIRLLERSFRFSGGHATTITILV